MASRTFDFSIEISYQGHPVLTASGPTGPCDPKKSTEQISGDVFAAIVRQMQWHVRLNETR